MRSVVSPKNNLFIKPAKFVGTLDNVSIYFKTDPAGGTGLLLIAHIPSNNVQVDV